MNEEDAVPPRPPPDEPLLHGGGPVDLCKATLRVIGDRLDPEEITTLLGCQPSHSYQKGEQLHKGHMVKAKVGGWFLRSKKDSTPIAEKVTQLLQQATEDSAAWTELTTCYQVDVFCGIFLKDLNRGFELPSSLVKDLARRGLTLEFDIYCIGRGSVNEDSGLAT